MSTDDPVIIAKPMILVPPAPERCQECAVVHSPSEAHDRDSLYYLVHFRQGHGRWPTWEDAIAHCDPELQAIVREIVAAHVAG